MKFIHSLILLFVIVSASAHPDIETRITVLTKKIHDNPTNGLLYIARGKVQQEHQKWQAANKDYSVALQMSVYKPLVQLNQAQLLRQQNKLKQAKRVLTQAENELTKTKSDNLSLLSQIYLLLAEISDQQKHWLMAGKYYSSALKSWPRNTIGVYLAAATAYQKAGLEHYNKAIRILDDLLARKAGLISAHNLAIEIEVSRGHYNSAKVRLKRLLKLYPNLKTQNKPLNKINHEN